MQDLAQPTTLEEALGLLAAGGYRVLAGATDLYPAAGTRLQGKLVDLAQVPGYSGINIEGGLRIGAGTSWTEIAETSLPSGLCALQTAARQIGGRQVQNAGTIGGNLCNASPAADGVPPLLVAGAEVELAAQDGTRLLPLSEFLLGARKTALRPGEFLSAVIIPEAGCTGRSAFAKLGARRHLVISIAMVAVRVRLAEEQVVEVALAVGACSPVARRLPAVEAVVVGATAAEAVSRIDRAMIAAALDPIDDVRATADYRCAAAGELVCRALTEALA
jgi:CO/xanthine dehydrogenase FAD-binding subunit